jgi:hypothetical protein
MYRGFRVVDDDPQLVLRICFVDSTITVTEMVPEPGNTRCGVMVRLRNGNALQYSSYYEISGRTLTIPKMLTWLSREWDVQFPTSYTVERS